MYKLGKRNVEKLYAPTQKKNESFINKEDKKRQQRVEHGASLKTMRLAKAASVKQIVKELNLNE